MPFLSSLFQDIDFTGSKTDVAVGSNAERVAVNCGSGSCTGVTLIIRIPTSTACYSLTFSVQQVLGIGQNSKSLVGRLATLLDSVESAVSARPRQY
jgi:hypothetical protein